MTRIGSRDCDIFPVVLGGNVFGWTADQPTSFDILDRFVDGGGDLIDTADGYSRWVPGNAGGESETIIGAWCTARRNRDRVLIATKVGTHPQFTGLRPQTITAAIDASLTRLRTDHVDLYYAHFDDADVPMDEIAGTLSMLVDAGKVRHVAPSNFSPARIDEWARVCDENGLHPPIALQPEYNLMERGFETNGLRDAAARHHLGVLTYYSLASGFLTGKYRPGVAVPGDRASRASTYLTPRGEAVLTALEQVGAAHDVPPAAVALAWLRHRPTVVAPIASASTVDQVPALLASATLDLTPAEMAQLTSASDTR
ncbi:MAG: aldo/keto reductase [Propionibacteriaceae bacterium]|nr:aldo/keto reductase [Propionibacteriaceae bacterium]